MKLKKKFVKKTEGDTSTLLLVSGIEKQAHNTPKCFSIFR
jgi:hypothetical protein